MGSIIHNESRISSQKVYCEMFSCSVVRQQQHVIQFAVGDAAVEVAEMFIPAAPRSNHPAIACQCPSKIVAGPAVAAVEVAVVAAAVEVAVEVSVVAAVEVSVAVVEVVEVVVLDHLTIAFQCSSEIVAFGDPD